MCSLNLEKKYFFGTEVWPFHTELQIFSPGGQSRDLPYSAFWLPFSDIPDKSTSQNL